MALEELNDSTTLSRFDGSNPVRWLFEVERFFCLYKIYEEERFPYVVEYFDDEPFYWFNSWGRGHEHLTWKSFAIAMLRRFTTTTATVTKNTDTPPLPTRQPPATTLVPVTKTNQPPPPELTAPATMPKHPSYVIPSAPKTSNTLFPKQASKPARAPTETRTRNSLPNTLFLPLIMMKPKTIGRREWRPPWRPQSSSVESASKAIVASPTPPNPPPSPQPLPPTHLLHPSQKLANVLRAKPLTPLQTNNTRSLLLVPIYEYLNTSYNHNSGPITFSNDNTMNLTMGDSNCNWSWHHAFMHTSTVRLFIWPTSYWRMIFNGSNCSNTYGIWSISKSSKQRIMERMHKNLTIPFFLTMEYGRISGEEDATLLSSSAPGPYATIRREWRPPWCYVETIQNIVVQLEWQPASRYVGTEPNATGRREWQPP